MSRAGPAVVVGSAEDDHVRAVMEALRARDAPTALLDPLRFPESVRLSLGEEAADVTIDGRRLGRPAVVYLRSLYLSPLAFGVDVAEAMEANWRRMLIALREKAELLVSVMRRWEAFGVPIYNPLTASDALRKPYQLSRLAAAGLPVPETLWTNDPDAVRRFAAGRRVAYKPVAGGAATRELSPDDLTGERLDRLGAAPVTFQELLPGEDVRVYVLDGEIVAAFRIEADALDFRQHESRIEAIDLEPEVAALCQRASELLSLRFTGIDVKATADGRPRILELNGSPMFLGFDARAGTDVLGRLADALAAHAAAG